MSGIKLKQLHTQLSNEDKWTEQIVGLESLSNFLSSHLSYSTQQYENFIQKFKQLKCWKFFLLCLKSKRIQVMKQAVSTVVIFVQFMNHRSPVLLEKIISCYFELLKDKRRAYVEVLDLSMREMLKLSDFGEVIDVVVMGVGSDHADVRARFMSYVEVLIRDHEGVIGERELGKVDRVLIDGIMDAEKEVRDAAASIIRFVDGRWKEWSESVLKGDIQPKRWSMLVEGRSPVKKNVKLSREGLPRTPSGRKTPISISVSERTPTRQAKPKPKMIEKENVQDTTNEEELQKFKDELEKEKNEIIKELEDERNASMKALEMQKKELEEKFEELKAKEIELVELSQSALKESSAVKDLSANTGKIVRLSIGGTKFVTSRTTVQSAESFFTEIFDSEVEYDGDSIFIDRDPTHFRYVLNFLRMGEDMHVPESVEVLKELLLEAQFYRLEGLVNLIATSIETNSSGMDFKII